VSTLLLDDTFKPATPLTNGAINKTLQQFASFIDISQNTVVGHPVNKIHAYYWRLKNGVQPSLTK